MDKIYRRSTQKSGTPKKKKDEHNRKRNRIINFRVSPAEKELIDARIRLSGKARAEFFIESCLYQAILVKGNVRTFTEIKRQMAEIGEALKESPNLATLDSKQIESLRIILEILQELFKWER